MEARAGGLEHVDEERERRAVAQLAAAEVRLAHLERQADPPEDDRLAARPCDPLADVAQRRQRAGDAPDRPDAVQVRQLSRT